MFIKITKSCLHILKGVSSAEGVVLALMILLRMKRTVNQQYLVVMTKKVTEDEAATNNSKIDDKKFQSEIQLEKQPKNIIEDDLNHEPTESGKNEVKLFITKVTTIP